MVIYIQIDTTTDHLTPRCACAAWGNKETTGEVQAARSTEPQTLQVGGKLPSPPSHITSGGRAAQST